MSLRRRELLLGAGGGVLAAGLAGAAGPEAVEGAAGLPRRA